MNEINHMLVCLAEEGGEIAKECCKSLRFGLDDQVTRDPKGPRGTEGPNNREKIVAEVIDLIAVYELLRSEGVLPDIGLRINHGPTVLAIQKKANKVRAYMDYAENVGALRRAGEETIS